MVIADHYDFSCWLIKYGSVSINGRLYQKDSLQNTDGLLLPLLWNHQHNDLPSVLGYALLANREDGIFAYCTLYDVPQKEIVINLINDEGSVSLSPYINQIEYDTKNITHGIIKEVSLVLKRFDPDPSYYPVMNREKN